MRGRVLRLTCVAGCAPMAASNGTLAEPGGLVANGRVDVVDEPLVHVDTARAGGYWRVIRERIAASGASLVFATHVPETVLAEAECAICVREGRVVSSGPVAEL